MSYPPVIAGFAGVVAGVVIGLAIGGSMVGDRIDTAVSNAMASAQEGVGDASSATGEAITALGDRMAALEASIAEGASDTTAISEDVRAQLGEMQDSLAARIDSVAESAGAGASDLRTALDEMQEGMRARMQEMGEGMRARMGGGSSDASEEPASADAGADSAAPSGGEGVSAGVGHTAIFGDGAVRAFVSRIDSEGGAARISVNGDLTSIAVGEAATVSVDGAECSVFLSALDDASATLSSDCGANSGEAAAEETAAADVPAAPEDGFRAGQMANFADGALRVFVSGMAGDRSGARLAINGVETQTVAAGDSVEVSSGDQTCTLTVTGVGDGVVGLEGSCG